MNKETKAKLQHVIICVCIVIAVIFTFLSAFHLWIFSETTPIENTGLVKETPNAGVHISKVKTVVISYENKTQGYVNGTIIQFDIENNSKYITLESGNRYLIGNDLSYKKLGDQVTLEHLHQKPVCVATWMKLSNGTVINGTLARSIFDDPDKFKIDIEIIANYQTDQMDYFNPSTDTLVYNGCQDERDLYEVLK